MQAPNSTSHDIEKLQDQERERTSENTHNENCGAEGRFGTAQPRAVMQSAVR